MSRLCMSEEEFDAVIREACPNDKLDQRYTKNNLLAVPTESDRYAVKIAEEAAANGVDPMRLLRNMKG